MSDNLTTHNRLAKVLKRLEKLEKELADLKVIKTWLNDEIGAQHRFRQRWYRQHGP